MIFFYLLIDILYIYILRQFLIYLQLRVWVYLFIDILIFKCWKLFQGTWWMPWFTEAMKDVISCDKLGLVAHRLFDPEISEWANPPVWRSGITIYVYSEANAGNWNILLPVGEENNLMIPLVVASERGLAQTICVFLSTLWGCRTTYLWFIYILGERSGKSDHRAW